MPRQSRAAVESESEEEVAPTQRRRRAQASDESEEDENGESMISNDGGDGEDQVVKRFVRYALACEYQRMPIRRAAILERVFLKRRVNFRKVFDLTQKQLRSKFGMELIELPVKEKITMKDKRAAQKSKTGGPKSSSSYILTTILPSAYRGPTIVPPSFLPSPAAEAEYVALCTTLVALIYLSPQHNMQNAKFESVLNRLNCSKNMGTLDTTPNILKKMQAQGYLVRTVEKGADEEQIDWSVGPRGKTEIGQKGIEGLVRAVYGEDVPEDLDKRLDKSLGVDASKAVVNGDKDEEGSADEPGPSRRR